MSMRVLGARGGVVRLGWLWMGLVLAGASCSLTAGAGAAAGSPVTIRYMYWGGENEQSAVDELIRRFEAANPGIQVKPENTPYPEYGDKIPILLASGAGPDVIMLPPYLLPSLAAAGALAPLDEFIARDTSFRLDDFVVPARSIFRVDGRLYALPREFGPYVLFYNRTMFTQKGLTEPDASWTWETMVAAGHKLTEDRDGDGQMDRYALGGVGWINHYLPFVWQAGGEVVEAKTRQVLIDSPASVRGLQFYADLMLKERINPTYDELLRGRVNIEEWFASDRLAMSYNSRIAVGFYNQFKDLDYDVALLPKGPVSRAMLVDPAAIAIVAGTRQPEAAWRFFKWLVGPEAARLMSTRNLLVPALLSVVRSEAFVNPDVPPRHDLVFVEAMQYGRTVPLIPEWNEVSGVIGQGMLPVLRGQAGAAQATTQMASRIKQILSRPVRK